MLKRLYIHNYKCLVNFEINFDKDISLFLGANGSGKSTVFEVLAKIAAFVAGIKVENVFSEMDFPRWSMEAMSADDASIIIEMDIERNNVYKYRLELGFVNAFWNTRTLLIKNELLHCNHEKIFEFDRSFFGTEYSGVARCNQALEFQNCLRGFLIARIVPSQMRSNIRFPSPSVAYDFSNFSEWFAYLHETNRRGITNFEREIREVLPSYDIFTIQPSGLEKLLRFEFENKSNKKVPITYYFHELSEGQRALIALYTLIYCTADNSIICIDEPENFLALPEIQPWFDKLYQQCEERNLQVLLISHHPQIINFLANDSGCWFSRENNLTRMQKITPEDESGLSISELVERGWIYEP